ncbi:MAG: Ku protein [Alphaproteobacteria bacterium]|nr:Ku protein [Alphaproteobacteria bacterium]
MAQRPIWRGHLRLALVSCPVALYSARHDRGDLHFHFINPKTGHRVKMVTLDAETDEELSRRDLVKGYEFKKDHYLIMSDEDFDAAKVESSSTMTVDKFVDAESIDPIYYDSSYFVAPDGDAGQDVYVVLREAIAKTGRVALSRVVIARRERTIAIMPMQNGMVVHTLHEERDLNNPKALFDEIPDAKPDPEMVKLATQLIDRQTGRYDPADTEDRYEARLRAVIEAKLKGEGITPDSDEEPDRGNVIDLMAALKKSLGQTTEEQPSGGRSRPASQSPAKKSAPKPKSASTRSSAKKPARKRA